MKNYILSLGLFLLFIAPSIAQDNNLPKKTTTLQKVANSIDRYNDSTDRVNELKKLVDVYINIKADLEAVKKERHVIEEFHIGRTQEEKIEQERQNDEQTDKLSFRKAELETEIKQKSDAYKKLYEHKNK